MATIDRGDCDLWWTEEGNPDGPAVLLIMGFGYPSSMWFRVVPALADRYRVLRYDNRGTGATGVPPGPYPVPLMAEDGIAVLDAAGVDRAHVIGASMGGGIAQSLALDFPERVRSLVLACTAAGGPTVIPSESSRHEAAAAEGLSPEEAAELHLRYVYARATPREMIDEDLAVRAAQPTAPEGMLNQAQGVAAFAAVGTVGRLHELRMPTLVITGDEDGLVHPENSRLIADHIAGSELVVIAGASHVLFTDQPEASTRALRDFLDRH